MKFIIFKVNNYSQFIFLVESLLPSTRRSLNLLRRRRLSLWYWSLRCFLTSWLRWRSWSLLWLRTCLLFSHSRNLIRLFQLFWRAFVRHFKLVRIFRQNEFVSRILLSKFHHVERRKPLPWVLELNLLLDRWLNRWREEKHLRHEIWLLLTSKRLLLQRKLEPYFA